MKALARSFVWWPGIDNDLESVVKECNQCQLTRHSPAQAPLHPWEFPAAPYMPISLVHSLVRCFLWWSTLSLNGWKWFSY